MSDPGGGQGRNLTLATAAFLLCFSAVPQAPLCGLADLVALKRRSGRSSDLEDLAKLESAHGELPETE